MLLKLKASADWRALTSASLIGTGVGLALGAAYMAGGMARATTDHQRAARLAEAAAGGFSESVLQAEAADMDPGVLRVARRHDPFTVAGAAERDRQSAILASRLERRQAMVSHVDLRGTYGGPFAVAAAPFHLASALESSRELECLTQAVYFEARGETPNGQAAVAQVVLNRVRHPAFPKTVCGVVFQGAARASGCQFSFACDGSMRRGREMIAWSRAQRVAARALTGAVMVTVGDATHFHTTNVAPNWGPRMLQVAQVGLHVFYRYGRGGPSSYDAAPELSTGSVFAEGSVPAPAPLAPQGVTADFRLASAVTSETISETAGRGVGGPMQSGLEPASAPDTKSETLRPAT